MCGIAIAHGRRQGNQGGAVVNGGDRAEQFGCQGEEVPAEQFDGAAGVALERAEPGADRFQPDFGEEGGDGYGAQFDTDDAAALVGQPKQI